MAFLKLIRYKNLFMVLLTMVLTKYALIHSLIGKTYLSNLDFSILVLSVLLITAGGYIINDIYDIETDRVNKPNKVFINNNISKKNAWSYYHIFSLIGLFLSTYLTYKNLEVFHFLYFLGTVLLLFIYSKFLKQQVLIGNLIIAFFCSLIIWITYSFNGLMFANKMVFFIIISYILFSFSTTLIREIIKDIEDINGDLKIKAKTLPIIIGRKRASKVAFFFTSFLLIFLLIVLQYLKNKHLFLGYGIVFILLPLLYFMYKLWFAETKEDFSKLSSLMKIIMLFGILSMLLFKFI